MPNGRIALFNPLSVSLRGNHVSVEPLSLTHLPELFVLGQEEEIWTFMSSGTPFRKIADAEAWLRKALASQASGDEVPFAIVDIASGKVAGTTRYMDIRRPHRALEIGSTWYGKPFRRTWVNTETKLLLLDHAFDQLDAVRVQLQTDSRNMRSQQAIERIGASREGRLRQHKICSDGYVRDSILYSITVSEWPGIKERLQSFLHQTRIPTVQ